MKYPFVILLTVCGMCCLSMVSCKFGSEGSDEDIVAEFADCTRMDPSEIVAIAQEIRNIYYIDQPEEDKI